MSAVFAFGTATAKDIQTILITRFFAGVFGSSPISITGGSIVDIWSPRQRGTPMVCYGITIAAAPTLGPIIGGALIETGCRWRWTEYLTGIVMMVQFLLDVLWLDESHADVLLARKADGLRRATGNFVLHTKVSGLSTRPVSIVSLTNGPILLTLPTYSGKRRGQPSETSSASISSALFRCSLIRFACC